MHRCISWVADRSQLGSMVHEKCLFDFTDLPHVPMSHVYVQLQWLKQAQDSRFTCRLMIKGSCAAQHRNAHAHGTADHLLLQMR